MMKAMMTSLAALLLVAGVVGQADAASSKKKRLHKPSKPYTEGVPSRRSGRANGGSDYYENILEKVPFGSDRWWEVYGRQRGTPDG